MITDMYVDLCNFCQCLQLVKVCCFNHHNDRLNFVTSCLNVCDMKYTCNDCLQLIMDNMMNTKWCADKYVFVNFYNIKYTFDDRIQQMM